MKKLDFLKHTASETIVQIAEKLYSGQNIDKDCPKSVSREEALEDIAYLRFVMENAYSGYTYYEKALFDNAFSELEREAGSENSFTPEQIANMIFEKLGFITDGHLQLFANDEMKHFYTIEKTYISDLRIVEKDGSYYDEKTGEKVAFASPVRAFPTVCENGENAFLLGIRSKKSIDEIEVTLGKRAVKLPVHRIKSAKKGEDFLHKERYLEDTAIITCSSCGSDSEEDKQAMREIGEKCRGYKRVIWDLSNNGGGNSELPQNFMNGLTGGICEGQGIKVMVLESTAVKAKLTGEIEETPYGFVPEEPREGKTFNEVYADLFPGELHVVINDGIASSGELAAVFATQVPRVKFYGCNTAGIGRFGDIMFYYLPHSQITLACPFKVFDMGIEETFGFGPDYWGDHEDVVSVILKKLGVKDGE